MSNNFNAFRYSWIAIVVIVGFSVPVLVSHMYDTEVKLGKLIVEADLYLTLMEDFCSMEEEIACQYLIDMEDEIELIRSYDFVLVDYDELRERWIDSKRWGDMIRYWEEERKTWWS